VNLEWFNTAGLLTVWYSIVGFNVPLDTLEITLQMIFPASYFTGAKCGLPIQSQI